jgi:hypothetical protein
MSVIERVQYAVNSKVPTFILLEVIEALKTADTFETKHAAGRLAEFVNLVPKTAISFRVSDKDIVHLYDDVLREFGYDRKFYAAEAVEKKCGPAYVYENKGGEALRMGMLFGDLKREGMMKCRTAGKGKSKWSVINPDDKD